APGKSPVPRCRLPLSNAPPIPRGPRRILLRRKDAHRERRDHPPIVFRNSYAPAGERRDVESSRLTAPPPSAYTEARCPSVPASSPSPPPLPIPCSLPSGARASRSCSPSRALVHVVDLGAL